MLQHPGVKCMQATVKENLYWAGIDSSIEKMSKPVLFVRSAKLPQ
jgi:hypothetical protein